MYMYIRIAYVKAYLVSKISVILRKQINHLETTLNLYSFKFFISCIWIKHTIIYN